MRHLTLQPEEFIPIQANGVYRDRLDALSMSGEKPIPPVETVEHSDGYLLLDGNHRVYYFMLQGREVNTRVLETDEDVRPSKAISLIGCNSLTDIIKKYKDIWKPLCEERGVKSIRDYRVQKPIRESRYQL